MYGYVVAQSKTPPVFETAEGVACTPSLNGFQQRQLSIHNAQFAGVDVEYPTGYPPTVLHDGVIYHHQTFNPLTLWHIYVCKGDPRVCPPLVLTHDEDARNPDAESVEGDRDAHGVSAFEE